MRVTYTATLRSGAVAYNTGACGFGPRIRSFYPNEECAAILKTGKSGSFKVLDLLVARQYFKKAETGKTWPCFLMCESASGEEIEVVAKFSAGCERGVGGLVAEGLAAMLAADLGLPVPEPFLVSFDNAFIDAIPASSSGVADRLRASVRMAFGSRKLPGGFNVYPPQYQMPAPVRQQAAEIFAYDWLISNHDRRPENPNLLFDGDGFAIFDHEFAFMTEGVLGWEPPWIPGSLQSACQRHILFAGLCRQRYNWTRFIEAWDAISDERLQEYRCALPPEWGGGSDIAVGALAHVSLVRENVRPAVAEVSRALA
jgi:hypothetical protein